jgi:hypothetical protein
MILLRNDNEFGVGDRWARETMTLHFAGYTDKRARVEDA